MIYLDTHVVVWLYAGLIDRLSNTARQLINDNDVFISPVVRLELQYLLEVERVTAAPDAIVADLAERIGLQVCAQPFNRIVSEALATAWTRDPFDRLIAAHASLNRAILVTKDGNMLRNYPHARWA